MSHKSMQHHQLVLFGAAAALLVSGSLIATPPVGEDFNAGSAENWQPDDPLKDTFGPTAFEIDNGANRITTQPLPPIPQFVGAASVFIPSAVDPDSYSDGTVRAKVRFHNEATNAGIFMRAVGSGGVGTGYHIFLNNFQDFIGISDIAVGGGNIAGTGFPLDVGVDYMVEGRTVGSEISIKVWVHGEPEPAEPQVSITDSLYPDGGFVALVVYNQSSNSGGTGGVLDVSFDDFTFTPHGSHLLDDFTDGMQPEWATLDLTAGIDPALDFVDSRAVFTSIGPAAVDDTFGLVHIPSIFDPTYSNGRVRAVINVVDTNAHLYMRGDAANVTTYAGVFRPTDGLIGIERADGINQKGQVLGEALTSGFSPYSAGEDLYMEFSVIGDTLTLKVWAATEDEPAEPQLTVQDDTYSTGAIGFAANGPAVIDRPAPFHAEFSAIWFTPADPAPSCPGDLTNNGSVGVPDLLELLAAWGDCPAPCPADLTGSGTVGVPDLLQLLAAWGPCPG